MRALAPLLAALWIAAMAGPSAAQKFDRAIILNALSVEHTPLDALLPNTLRSVLKARQTPATVMQMRSADWPNWQWLDLASTTLANSHVLIVVLGNFDVEGQATAIVFGRDNSQIQAHRRSNRIYMSEVLAPLLRTTKNVTVLLDGCVQGPKTTLITKASEERAHDNDALMFVRPSAKTQTCDSWDYDLTQMVIQQFTQVDEPGPNDIAEALFRLQSIVGSAATYFFQTARIAAPGAQAQSSHATPAKTFADLVIEARRAR